MRTLSPGLAPPITRDDRVFAWIMSDCSGVRCLTSPNRDVQYEAQDFQIEVNQGVESPGSEPGLNEISQPFMTARRKPFLGNRSR